MPPSATIYLVNVTGVLNQTSRCRFRLRVTTRAEREPGRIPARAPISYGQGPAPLVETLQPVVLNVLLAVLPRKTTARMITAAIRATMTAYSTAVAPRSLFRGRRATNHADARCAVCMRA